EYVEVNRDALVEGIDVDADAVASHFEANKENYTQPERKRFAHILIEVNDDRPGEAALQIISDIAAEISAGKDFAALARERSEDSGSGANGGDLDYQEAGTFVPEFETAGHALTVGEVSSPVKTEFGYHLIKLLDVEEARVPVLADIQEQIAKDLLQSRAEEQFIDLSSRLGELAYEANDLQEPAETLGLVVKTTGLITRHETQGIGVSPKVMEAAYSAEVFDDGNNSDTIAIDENHHVVIRVTDHRPSELKPITDVREDIVDAIARERAELAARDQALKITGMLEEGSLTRYIENEFEVDFQNLPDATRNQLGMDRAINEEGFRLPRPAPDGKSIGQGVLSNGDAFVITVTRVNDVQGDELLKEDVSNIGRVLATRSGQNNYASFRAYYKAENEVWIKPEFGN
ncbi:MAG: peptidylprolyl isomerase, partial [Gammaproteobacteria bacterium]|nr:peptidylprolyl isomerase [Gammaproteobacteria bacterium]